jgi:hypothetical protein
MCFNLKIKQEIPVSPINTIEQIKFYLVCTLVSFSRKSIIYEKFEDTKGVIRICKLKNRQHNGQKIKDKRTNNDLQNITQKLKIKYHEPH